jgi:signal transduction histidine kinase
VNPTDQQPGNLSQAIQTAPELQASPTILDDALIAELQAVPILSSLKRADILCLDGLETVRIPAGIVFVRQGEAAQYLWLLLEGEVQLFETVPNDRDLALVNYTTGSSFGELPLLSNLPNPANVRALVPSRLVRLDEPAFWKLMTICPDVRRSILRNMAIRLGKLQNHNLQQEKMASLGTLAAGLMHELNNPGTAARRAASQLRENLMRLHALSAKFSKTSLDAGQKQCLFDLQEQALAAREPRNLSSLEQSDAEEQLAEWMESADIEGAWKLAPTLAAIGMDASTLECARSHFPAGTFADALSWLEALVSSIGLVGTIEESIGRVSELVQAVKTYAYEGKGQRQTIDVNDSIRATVIILAHKLREKEITLDKQLAANLPTMQTDCRGLNQIWTNLLDNAIDAVPTHGKISISTWAEASAKTLGTGPDLYIRVADNGSGIPPEIQPSIFDPFFTTKDVGVGTGLGLGIIHRIVEQYGGIIHFSSEPGHTEFVVRLPSERPDVSPQLRPATVS